jgi:excisionase family DNA binding protein
MRNDWPAGLYELVREAVRQGVREGVLEAFRELRPGESQPQRLVSVADAASVLGVSKHVVYEMIWRQDLPHTRVGRRVLVSTRALEEFMTRGVERNSTPTPPR